MLSSSGISLSFLRKLVVGAALLTVPVASFGSIFISVGFAPPPLPIYSQPLCPGEGYLWTPGYWAYDGEAEDGYFWVPGTWVEPPQYGYLWTPGYWGYGESAYFFHPGYWGPHIGFYGGVNYGFGYGGRGYEGGYWEGNRFNYNRSVNNVNVTNIRNTYVKNVTVVNNYNNVSYNGGQGGIQARPGTQELRAQREQHVQPTLNQVQHQQLAAADKSQFAKVNGGRPPVVAARTPEAFKQTVQGASFAGRGNAVNNQGGDRQSRIAQAVRAGAIVPGSAATVQNRGNNIHPLAQTAVPSTPAKPATQQPQRPTLQPPVQGNQQTRSALQQSTQPRPQVQQPQTQQQRPMYQPPVQQPRPQVQQPQMQQPRPQVQQQRPTYQPPTQQQQPRSQYQSPQVQQPRPQVQQPQAQQPRPMYQAPAQQQQPRPQYQQPQVQQQSRPPMQEQRGGSESRPRR